MRGVVVKVVVARVGACAVLGLKGCWAVPLCEALCSGSSAESAWIIGDGDGAAGLGSRKDALVMRAACAMTSMISQELISELLAVSVRRAGKQSSHGAGGYRSG